MYTTWPWLVFFLSLRQVSAVALRPFNTAPPFANLSSSSTTPLQPAIPQTSLTTALPTLHTSLTAGSSASSLSLGASSIEDHTNTPTGNTLTLPTSTHLTAFPSSHSTIVDAVDVLAAALQSFTETSTTSTHVHTTHATPTAIVEHASSHSTRHPTSKPPQLLHTSRTSIISSHHSKHSPHPSSTSTVIPTHPSTKSPSVTPSPTLLAVTISPSTATTAQATDSTGDSPVNAAAFAPSATIAPAPLPSPPPPSPPLSKPAAIGVGVAVPGAALIIAAVALIAIRKSRKDKGVYCSADEFIEKGGPKGPDNESTAGFPSSGNHYSPIAGGTAYNSGAYTISSPLSNSLRTNVILPARTFGFQKLPTTNVADCGVDHEIDLGSGRVPLAEQRDWPLRSQARNILSGLGIALGRGAAHRDIEVAEEESQPKVYPEVAYLYDPPVPVLHKIPQPPAFSSRASHQRNQSFEVGDDSGTSSLLSRPSPSGDHDDREGRISPPHLRIETAHLKTHASTAQAPQQLPNTEKTLPLLPRSDTDASVYSKRPAQLGAVSRMSVSQASYHPGAAGVASTDGSIRSWDDVDLVSAEWDLAASRSSSARTQQPKMVDVRGVVRAGSVRTVDIARNTSQRTDVTASGSLQRRAAVKKSVFGSINERPASTIYSRTAHEDEEDVGSPLMSAISIERQLEDFRELARWKSLRNGGNAGA
ncbi:hypothetical protein FH972_023626 [Carpinus fangiana]|uniref:Uncharacterized protein n=1 Tax=Carpinus fangiana TaxID=176857 RepID=A0A5N6KWC7_9ROSI|nr:hypothetical protein FH972_023626 [Carpinus fangiana]